MAVKDTNYGTSALSAEKRRTGGWKSKRTSSSSSSSKTTVVQVFPSEQAHQDIIESSFMPRQEKLAFFAQNDVTLDSTREKVFGKDEKIRLQRHELRYKGELVWTLETRSIRNRVDGTSVGATSTCHLTPNGDEIFIHLMGKGSSRRALSTRNSISSDDGQASWGNSQQMLVLSLEDILRESALEWANEQKTLQ